MITTLKITKRKLSKTMIITIKITKRKLSKEEKRISKQCIADIAKLEQMPTDLLNKQVAIAREYLGL